MALACSGVGGITFSPDSKRVAYTAKLGDKSLVVIDGVEGHGYDGIGAESPVFSPDSERLAYMTKRGDKQLVVVDEVEGNEYDEDWRWKSSVQP